MAAAVVATAATAVDGNVKGAGKTHRIQRAGAIRPDNHVPGSKVLLR
jgi:hypothetical protein